MAIYHFSVKVVSRGKGASAVAKAAYISGEKIKNEYDDKTHDYGYCTIAYSQILQVRA